jgi:hypothetical protein
MGDSERFSIQYYYATLTRLWFSPGRFFSENPESRTFGKPFAFLLLSSLFFAAASLLYIHEQVVFKVTILLFNALAMPFVAAAFGYLVMTMTMGKRTGYLRLFTVYAFASGATLLLAWIPFSLWFTETWKWVLIGIGLVRACRFRPLQAVAVIGFSVIILILFFWSLGPVILWFKGTGP